MPDTFEIISFIAVSSVCFNCYTIVYNSIAQHFSKSNMAQEKFTIDGGRDHIQKLLDMRSPRRPCRNIRPRRDIFCSFQIGISNQ